MGSDRVDRFLWEAWGVWRWGFSSAARQFSYCLRSNLFGGCEDLIENGLYVLLRRPVIHDACSKREGISDSRIGEIDTSASHDPVQDCAVQRIRIPDFANIAETHRTQGNGSKPFQKRLSIH